VRARSLAGDLSNSSDTGAQHFKLMFVAGCCMGLQGVAAYTFVLGYTRPLNAAVCCSVLQCVAVRCSALQCYAACCSVIHETFECCSVLQCVEVCCSALQCVAVLCSVLQCDTRDL